MNRKLKKRSEILSITPDNYNNIEGLVLSKQNNGEVMFDKENQTLGKCEDYNIRNLIELGVPLNPTIILNDSQRLNVKDRFESFAKSMCEKLNINE